MAGNELLSVAGFSLGRAIGRSRSGAVHVAVEQASGRRVALRLIDPAVPADAVRRYEEAARRAAELDHLAVAGVYGAGTAVGGQRWVALELVEGPSLATALAERALDRRRLAEALALVAEALHEAHQSGLVHGDLRADRIRLDPAGAPRLLDFGAVHLRRPAGPRPSPSPAGDVEAIGRILALALGAGGDAPGTAPEPLREACARALAPRPGDRPGAGELARALAEAAASLGPPAARPAPGEVRSLGRFELRRPLGEGGFGRVYEAWDPHLDRAVALKVLHHVSPQARRRFVAEGRAAARLRHPGIVGVHEAGVEDGTPFLVMELVAGRSLAAVVNAEGPLPPAAAARAARDAARAVDHAHAAGVIHRDLKPGNVVLEPDGAARILDFGLARIADGAHLTRTGDVVGTPAYLPPELADGRGRPPTAASDVYGLGAVLFETLTGRPPFVASTTTELIVAVLTQPSDPPSAFAPDVGAALDAICLRCLAKDPTERYPSAAALADALDEVLEPAPATPTPPEPARAAPVSAGPPRTRSASAGPVRATPAPAEAPDPWSSSSARLARLARDVVSDAAVGRRLGLVLAAAAVFAVLVAFALTLADLDEAPAPARRGEPLAALPRETPASAGSEPSPAPPSPGPAPSEPAGPRPARAAPSSTLLDGTEPVGEPSPRASPPARPAPEAPAPAGAPSGPSAPALAVEVEPRALFPLEPLPLELGLDRHFLAGWADPGRLLRLDRQIQAAPDDARLFANRGNARLADGDSRGAIADYRRAVELDPGYGQAWQRLGDARRATGRLEEAEEVYTRGLERAPTRPRLWRDRGRVRLALERRDEARSDLERALELAPRDPLARLAAARLHELEGDLATALRELDRVIDRDPELLAARETRARILAVEGRRGAALAALDDLVDDAPERPWPRLARGWVRIRLGDLEAARADLRRAAELDGDDPRPSLGLGVVALELGEPAEAVVAAGEALRRDFDCAPAYLLRGLARIERGEPQRAIGDLRDFVAHGAGHPLVAPVRAALADR